MKNRFVRHCWRALKFSLRNLIRLMFFIIVLFCMLCAAGWYAAIKYINADHLGVTLAQILHTTFDRPVVIGGLKLTSFNEVSLSNVKVADTSLDIYNDFLSVGKLIIRYDLMPLLENKLVIKEVLLKDVSVNIIKDAQGIYNLPTLNIRSSETAAGQTFSLVTGGRKVDVVIEDWTIDNGTFSYRDISANTSHSLNGIYIGFSNLKFSNDTDYKLNFVLRNKVKEMITETEVSSKGIINLANFTPSNMVLTNAIVELRGFRQPLSFKLSAHNFIDPHLTFATALPAFTYDDVSLYLPKPYIFNIPATSLSADVIATNGYKTFKIAALKLNNKDIYLNADINLDFSLPTPHHDITFNTGDFDVSSVDYLGKLKQFAFSGKLTAKGEANFSNGKYNLPYITLDLKGVNASVSNFLIEGVKANATIKNNLDNWQATITDGIFKVGRQVVSKIKGTASYENKKQKFYALLRDSKFNGKNIRMDTTITKVRNAQHRIIKANLYMDKFEPMEVFYTVEDFVHALAPGQSAFVKEEGDLAWLHNFKKGIPLFMPNFSGIITAKEFYTPIISGTNFNAEFELKNLLPGIARLDGKIDAVLENGIIYKLQEAADRQKALGIAYQPFVLMNNMERAGSFKMGKVLKDTPFEIMAASVNFNNGKMDINNFYADGTVLAASVDGAVDWGSEAMDLDIGTMFKNTSKRGVLSENLTDESGEPALAFRVSGLMAKPSLQVRSPKKVGSKIKKAKETGLKTKFTQADKFVKGE